MVTNCELHSLIEESDGSFSGSYGPFQLKTGFQPIFSQNDQGLLRLEAFEGLIRPFKGGETVSPPQFFSCVEPGDGAKVDRLCRQLHLHNMGATGRRRTLLFLNVNPACLTAYSDMLAEAESMARMTRDLGLATSQIVCEITENEASNRHLLASLTETLRERNFKIAIDDYGAEDSDAERVGLLKPDFVKFDSLLVRRFIGSPAGLSLLQAMVKSFRDTGIQSLFEGLEEHWQVDACRHIGVQFLQGFTLAHPELAPTTFDIQFPEVGAIQRARHRAHESDNEPGAPAHPVPPVQSRQSASPRPLPRLTSTFVQRQAVFGRRGQ